METTPEPEPTSTRMQAVKARARRELREYAVTAAYLFVWLSGLLLYENALEGERGLAALPFGLAAGKALILGKFVLIAEGLGLGTRVIAQTLTHRIAWRSLAVLLLVALTVVEELVVGRVHGRSFGEVLAEFTHQPLEPVAKFMLMLLILVPFIAAKQISVALGPGVLRTLLTKAEHDPGS